MNNITRLKKGETIVTGNPLAKLMHRWLECQDAQAASQALARALSTQGHGDPVWPGPGIWPLPPG